MEANATDSTKIAEASNPAQVSTSGRSRVRSENWRRHTFRTELHLPPMRSPSNPNTPGAHEPCGPAFNVQFECLQRRVRRLSEKRSIGSLAGLRVAQLRNALVNWRGFRGWLGKMLARDLKCFVEVLLIEPRLGAQIF